MDDVVALVTDLFFQSRILAAARLAGRRVRFIVDSTTIPNINGHSLVLVDLDASADVISAIRDLAATSPVPVIAFGPHLDTEKRKAARAAGATRVLAKSKFTTELSHLMNDSRVPPGNQTLLLAELHAYGRKMEELGRWLQDPVTLRRLYFGPEPHMKADDTDPLILNEADYLDFIAVAPLKHRLERLHNMEAGAGDTTIG